MVFAEYFGSILRKEAEDIEEKIAEWEENRNAGSQSNLPTTDTNNEKSTGSEEQKDKEKECPVKKPDNFTGTTIRKSAYIAKGTYYKNHTNILFFIEEMNKTAEAIGLKYTFYDSCHGLSNTNNKSSAIDVSKLAAQAMKMKKFRDVVCTKFYSVKKNTNGNRRTYKWYNTHQMLG